MAIRHSISDFHGWWRNELADLIPARLRPIDRRPAAAVLTIRRDGILIAPSDPSSKLETVIADDAAAAVDHLRQNYFKLRIGRPAVSIIIEQDRYLKRQLSPLRLPASKMAAMARLDMGASTPFSQDDAFLVCGQSNQSNPESSYVVVKKAFLKPLIDQLRSAGIAVRELAFSGNGSFTPDPKSMLSVLPKTRWRIFINRLRTATVSLCVLGLAATVGHFHWRNLAAEAEVDRQILAAEKQASMVRALIAARNLKLDQVMSIRNEKLGAVPVVSIVEEMSRIIPDSTWLTDVQIDDGKVLFSGFSRSAAALIPILEESRLFRAPTFRTPVVRVANQQGERFTISMDVETSDG
ncbi:MAG: PilN domain-containing protein [Rhizobiaceae bacterium]